MTSFTTSASKSSKQMHLCLKIGIAVLLLAWIKPCIATKFEAASVDKHSDNDDEHKTKDTFVLSKSDQHEHVYGNENTKIQNR